MTRDRFDREQRLVQRLRRGGVAVFPTDTAYGLGASIHRPRAVRRVFRAKNRPVEKTVPVLVVPDQARRLARFAPTERAAARRFWPGGLTLVLTARAPDRLTAGLVRDGTLALRVPDYPPLLRVLKRAGPLVGTSANPSGDPTPTRAEELASELLEWVDITVRGPVPGGTSSTVAQWGPRRNRWTVHRAGAVSPDRLPQSNADPPIVTEEDPG